MKIKINKDDIINYYLDINFDRSHLFLNNSIILLKNDKFIIDPFTKCLLSYFEKKYNKINIDKNIDYKDYPSISELFDNKNVKKYISESDLLILINIYNSLCKNINNNKIIINNKPFNIPFTNILINLYFLK